MTKSRGLIAPRHAWSEFELEVMRRHYPDTLTRDLAELFRVADHVVYKKAEALGLYKSSAFLAGPMGGQLDGHRHHGKRFKTGDRSWCAGTKGVAGVHPNTRKTQFQKGAPLMGRNAARYIPIGGYRVNGEGYLDRKLKDDGRPQDRFERVHRLVWIEANGPVPENHVITFKLGTKTTKLEEITLDRLECLSRGEFAMRNRLPEELMEIHRLRGRITREINQLSKEEPHVQEHQ